MEIIGVATDGDIRRSLLDGKKLDAKILSLVNKEYIAIAIAHPALGPSIGVAPSGQ